ncbi:MAG: hypothetical protein HY423_02550, partial [Candidatus Lambdaproteobacteria bacterium]|nr:hypothetical protein [Candidatus Lambdaproteobacteria bacterium]
MPPDSPDLAALPLASTLFLPLTGNPAGFHHFASAEWMLRRDPALRRVVLILSNGRHPDPTKPGIAVDAETRLAVLRAALAAVADPARSALARRAEVAGEVLRVSPETVLVSTLEFAHARAVPTAETLGLIRAAHPGSAEPIHWFAGSDLVRRMAEPRIFSDPDVRVLA